MRQPTRPWAWTILAGCLGLACAAPGDRAVSTYVGVYSDNSLPEEILPAQRIQFEESSLVALTYSEVFHSFWEDQGRWEWELQSVKHFGEQTHVEFNALLALRWRSFPWNEYVRTSLAIGDGLSWASEVPDLEESSHTSDGAAQLLNYLMLEWTLGMPSVEEWDLILRIHHRSGVYGLFDGVEGGSNVLAIGLKYAF